MNQLAVRYIIYKCVEDYITIKNITIDEFNQDNNFTLEKCLQLPFFITVANGHKEKLIEGVFNQSFLPKTDDRTGVVVGFTIANVFTEHNAVTLNLEFNETGMLQSNFNTNEFNRRENWMSYVDKSIEFYKQYRNNEFSAFDAKNFMNTSMENFAFENIKRFYNDSDQAEKIDTFQYFVIENRSFLSSIKEFGEIFNWDIENTAA